MRNLNINIRVIVFTLMSVLFKSQDNSSSSSVLTPVAYQTGVPDISFPIVSLPAAKDFTLNFGLVYNANSYNAGDYCGQVARNWMLSGSNFTITRKIIDSYPDEPLPSHWEWDDIYYYNLNGEQGSFKFDKIGTFPNDSYPIRKLTPNNLKIEAERIETVSSWLPRHVQSFTITDSKGYKYYFQDYDQQKLPNGNNGITAARNIFYITKIIDSSSRQVATFQNEKYIKYVEHSNNTVIASWFYLPKTIMTDYGKIIIEHGDSGSLWDFHDRYYFKSFTLKDHKENFISKNVLDISNLSYRYYDIERFQSLEPVTIEVRYLNRLKKLDKNSNTLETTRFGYTFSPPSPPTWGSTIPSGVYQKNDFILNGLLNSVQLPSGGKIEYNFGIHSLKLDPPADYNTPYYINQIQNVENDGIPPFSYKVKTDSIAFDSHITKKYYLTGLQKSPSSRIYIKFFRDEIYPWAGNPENPWKGPGDPPSPKLAYKVKNYTNYNPSYDGEIEDLFAPRAYVVPTNGSAYLEITGSGGNGWFEIYEKFWSDPPYTILNTGFVDSGVKVESIKYYDRAQSFSPYYPSFDLKKTIEFDYNLFNEPEISSGIAVPDDQKEAIIYRNITLKESDKPGYTRYYYKTSWDFPRYSHPSIVNTLIWPNFNISKKGILDKKELYNDNNNKIQSTIFGYTLPSYDLTKLYKYETLCGACEYGGVDPFYTQESFPEKVQTEETSYDIQGNELKTISEKTYNQSNNNLMLEKKTSADGIIMETNYKYASEKGNTKLLGASMFSVPLEVTQTQNGNVTGKIETLYDHPANFFPSSVKSYGINNIPINEEKNDIYDTMGNVLQSSSKTGISTAYIYGYNSTLLIAKIVGATYENVMTAFGQANTIEAYKSLEIYAKSNADISDSSEELLRQNLDEFRLMNAFKNYQITTYTYDPLIGVKSVTSPSGNKEYYYYDDANRMIRVEDINHNIIKENKYKQNLLN